MEQEGTDSQNAGSHAVGDEEEARGEQSDSGDAGCGGGFSTPAWQRREPTILTMQDLLDLPRQILPEETYFHLRNACREASLAAFSLWRSVGKARKASNNKVRTRIDVE